MKETCCIKTREKTTLLRYQVATSGHTASENHPPLTLARTLPPHRTQTLDLMQISHENESEHDIDIEVVGVGLASEDWDFRSFSAGTGPNPADPAEVMIFHILCCAVLCFCGVLSCVAQSCAVLCLRMST